MKFGVGNSGINFWIIREWGGIKTFKVSDSNQQRIEDFYSNLTEGRMVSLQTIASLSKVVSFADPSFYFIYDSRAVFSINWILRKAGATTEFFPFPPGRSKAITHCNLKGVLEFENRAFCNVQEAYYAYCQLIRSLYYDMAPHGNSPYLLEMLLFHIAPCLISEEFKSEFEGTVFYYTPCADSANNKEDVISKFNDCFIKRRKVEYGSLITVGGKKIYLLVGHSKEKLYCEILCKTQKIHVYPMQDVLLDKGFLVKGGSHPYLIKYLDKNHDAEMLKLYKFILETLRRIKKKHCDS